jgi:hypothetical protein
MMATEWNGPANMFAEPRTGQVLTGHAPRAGRRLGIATKGRAFLRR